MNSRLDARSEIYERAKRNFLRGAELWAKTPPEKRERVLLMYLQDGGTNVEPKVVLRRKPSRRKS